MKKFLIGLAIYLSGCVVTYPLNKWMVLDSNHRSWPNLYPIDHKYTKEDKLWVVGFCVTSWVGIPFVGGYWCLERISDSMDQHPKW